MKKTNMLGNIITLGDYQAGLEDANMINIPNLAETFGVISDFSDHTLGTTGVKVIEKHFILDKSIDGEDADSSLDKKEFQEMIQAVRDAEKLLGKIDYSMTEKKKKSLQFFRSLYIVKDIKKGKLFIEENMRSIRLNYSTCPKYLKDILRKKSIV